MEEARRRLQEKQDAKAAKFIEDKVQVSKTLNYGWAMCTPLTYAIAINYKLKEYSGFE